MTHPHQLDFFGPADDGVNEIQRIADITIAFHIHIYLLLVMKTNMPSRRGTLFVFVHRLTKLGVCLAANSNSGGYQNIEGSTLQSCSYDGTALTGYTRNGYCVDQDDDAGSHHICINLSSIASNGQNFCSVTGQSDWCSSTDMPCHENPDESTCAIENWCVCQWAFASYIEKAGGCDAIQDIQCDAINMKALEAYKSNYDKYGEALSCLYERCELDMSTYSYSLSSSANKFVGGSTDTDINARTSRIMIGLGVALAVVVGGLAFITIAKKRRGRMNIMDDDGGQGSWKQDDMTEKMSLDQHS